nr:hypothetical protein TetV2_00290 [Oceanusvirus sp.]
MATSGGNGADMQRSGSGWETLPYASPNGFAAIAGACRETSLVCKMWWQHSPLVITASDDMGRLANDVLPRGHGGSIAVRADGSGYPVVSMDAIFRKVQPKTVSISGEASSTLSSILPDSVVSLKLASDTGGDVRLSLPNLKALDIRFGGSVELSVCPRLKRVRLGCAAARLALPNLETLDLFCEKLVDLDCPSLKRARIDIPGGRVRLDLPSLKRLFLTCDQLCVSDLPSLEKARFDCKILPATSIASVGHFRIDVDHAKIDVTGLAPDTILCATDMEIFASVDADPEEFKGLVCRLRETQGRPERVKLIIPYTSYLPDPGAFEKMSRLTIEIYATQSARKYVSRVDVDMFCEIFFTRDDERLSSVIDAFDLDSDSDSDSATM